VAYRLQVDLYESLKEAYIAHIYENKNTIHTTKSEAYSLALNTIMMNISGGSDSEISLLLNKNKPL
jgi:hypothetical protein